MAFLDRIFRDGVNPNIPRKSNHLIAAGLWTVARGEFTLAQFKVALGFQAADDGQLIQLVAYYQGLDAAGKERFFGDWTAWTILAEHNLVARAAFAARFGMTEQ